MKILGEEFFSVNKFHMNYPVIESWPPCWEGKNEGRAHEYILDISIPQKKIHEPTK
jgi:hypothetical protein